MKNFSKNPILPFLAVLFVVALFIFSAPVNSQNQTSNISYGPVNSIPNNGAVKILDSTHFLLNFIDSNNNVGISVCTGLGSAVSCGSEYPASSDNSEGANGFLSDITVMSPTKFVVEFLDGSNGNSYAVVGTVSGSAISYGSEYLIPDDIGSNESSGFMTTLSSTQFVTAFFNYNSVTGFGGATVVGTVSGSAISFGSESVFDNSLTGPSSSGPSTNVFFANLNSTKFAVGFLKNNYLETVVGTVSGSTISYGSEYQFSGESVVYSFQLTGLNSNQFIAGIFNNSSIISNVIGTVSGSAISYGTKYPLSDSNVGGSIVPIEPSIAVLDSTHFVEGFYDITASGIMCKNFMGVEEPNCKDYSARVVEGTISSGVVSYGQISDTEGNSSYFSAGYWFVGSPGAPGLIDSSSTNFFVFLSDNVLGSGNVSMVGTVALPYFNSGPSDGGSSTSTPTPQGSNVNFTATADNSLESNYYLAVCKTNSVTGNIGSAPTCDGGDWCISNSTAAGSQASCSYATSALDSPSNVWYAFACDNAGSCSSVSQGAGDSTSSPFVVNLAPSISAISDGGSSTGTPTSAGNNINFTGTATSPAGNNYYLAFCKTNAITANNDAPPTCGGGNWCISSSTFSGSQASCNYTTSSGDAGSDAWYAFACDYNAGSACSAYSQGGGWSETQPAGNNDENWYSVASNSDGTRLIAVAGSGGIYISSDSGSTWTKKYPSGVTSDQYYAAASNSNGSQLIASDGTTDILYISSNYGATWTQSWVGSGTGDFIMSAASSSDGTHLIAGVWGFCLTFGGHTTCPSFTGRLYISSDSGGTWNETQPDGNINGYWLSVASSSDGTHLIAAGGANVGLYTSTNSGSTWTKSNIGQGNYFSSVASSSDGTHLIVSGSAGLYISSNYGSTWTQAQPAGSNGFWYAVASSADGTHLVAEEDSGRIYVSLDSGATWTETQPAGNNDENWVTVASSADGLNLITGENPGRLYLYRSTVNSSPFVVSTSLIPVTTASATTNLGPPVNVNVTLTCNDGTGSGCNKTYYCVDTNNSCTPTTVYSDTIVVSTKGTSYVRYYSTDLDGNTETTKNTPMTIFVPSSTVLTSSLNPAVHGTSVTFTATVTTGATGTVQFDDNGVDIGSAVSLSGGNPNTATYTTFSLAVGTHSITASYSGNSNYYSSSVSNTLSQSITAAWSCGSALVDLRDSQSYSTVQIGSQCWMAQNLNVGTEISGSGDQGSSCSSIQKYCYGNTAGNCSTYGGLYQWNQTMCGSTTAGTQGICPSGWHVPTHDEWTTLERSVCASGGTSSGTCAATFPYDTTTTGWLGTSANEGTSLKSGGASGFNGLLAGSSYDVDYFTSLGTNANFWTSSLSGSDAWVRYLGSGGATVYRNANDAILETNGFSIRCLQNSSTTSTTSLVSSVDPSSLGQSVTFTATVTTGATGTVQFQDNGVNIGSAVSLNNGNPNTATYTTSSLTVGSHPITAVYSGDSSYSSSTSNTLNQTITSGSGGSANLQISGGFKFSGGWTIH